MLSILLLVNLGKGTSSNLPEREFNFEHNLFHPNVCRPCVWIHKSQGCLWKDRCRHCHLCPDGEVKRRKYVKILRDREGIESIQDAKERIEGIRARLLGDYFKTLREVELSEDKTKLSWADMSEEFSNS